MENKRDTNSFRVPARLLGHILAAMLGAAAGGSVGSWLPLNSAANSHFVTREQFMQAMGEMRERLVKIESKLDQAKEVEAAEQKRRR